MDERQENNTLRIDELQRRLDLLERENQRLRERMEPVLGPDNPCFDPTKFQRALQRILVKIMLPVWAMPIVLALSVMPHSPFRTLVQGMRVGPIPIVDLAGNNSGVHGLGLGIFAFGGAAVGVIAIGGLSIGIIAIGGGAIGVIAIGGGSVGLIALGGGACGYIAVGGGAAGKNALGTPPRRAFGVFLSPPGPRTSCL